MAVNPPPPSPSTSTNHDSATKFTDMDMDSLVHCASYLALQDVSNIALSCKYLNRVASSDSIWRRFYRERWPELEPSGATPREAYLGRYSDLQRFKFVDPLVRDVHHLFTKSSNLLFSNNSIIISEGPIIQILSIDKLLEGITSFYSLMDHRERITSMRLFPLKETTILRDKTEVNDNVLVTSSCDNSIRIWWRGICQRLFRGHKGPVTILSDKLLGDGSGKVFASGGEDTTVRIWSLNSRKKRDPHALKATLYGHEKPLVFMAVTGHNSSLLTTMSTDSTVRVWDTTVSSDHSSCCVGMTSVHGAPVGIKCHDSLVYIASGSSFEAVDLRTMKTAFKTSTNQENLFSFKIMPAKFLASTGGVGRAMLWDIRRSSGTGDAGQVAELDGHVGPVTHLHMDSYKIVTGGPEDPRVNIWDADTGNRMNSFKCWNLDGGGCCGMAVNGFRIVTAGYNEEECVLTFRDFNNAVSYGSSSENVIG